MELKNAASLHQCRRQHLPYDKTMQSVAAPYFRSRHPEIQSAF